MKVAAGIIGIIFGLVSLIYIGIFGSVIGTGASWLGSLGSLPSVSGIQNWGDTVQILSWLAPVLAIVGGALTFRFPIFGAIVLAISAFCHWSLLGSGAIGNLFAIPIAIAAGLALLGSYETAPGGGSGTMPDHSLEPQTAVFDRAKWDALIQYDKDIAAAVEQLRPLGKKWLDELAAAFLVLNDKTYLPKIVDQISTRARTEREEYKLLKVRDAQRQEELRQEQARLDQIRREQFLHWQKRLWGTRQKKLWTSGICALAVAVIATVILWPAPRITERVLWPNGHIDCYKMDCLATSMKSGGASADAIDFAEKLSAARGGDPAWAVELHHYGRVDLVSYDQPGGYYGGFALVNGTPSIIFPTLSNDILKNYPAFMTAYPNAFLLRGGGLVEETQTENGGQRFVFSYDVGECEACGPSARIEYAFDFDAHGRLLNSPVLGIYGVSAVNVILSPPIHP
jgi:hypothetical protein